MSRKVQNGSITRKPASGLFEALCDLETLRSAYEEVAKSVRADVVAEEENFQAFLQELRDDLQARDYEPAPSEKGHPSRQPLDSENRAWLRDQVVQVAMKSLLEEAFCLETSLPEPEEAIQWVAAAVNRGLTRGFAVAIEMPHKPAQKQHVAGVASQRIADVDVQRLFRKFLVPDAPQNQEGPLGCVAAGLAFAGIDSLLHEAKTIGSGDGMVHVEAARFSRHVIILVDRDPSYDWIFPAVNKRLHDALAELKLEIDPLATQRFDLTCGEKLLLVGYELSYSAANEGGVPRAHYRHVHREELAKAPIAQAQVNKKRQGPQLKLPKVRLGRWGWAGMLLVLAVFLADLGWLLVSLTGEKDLLRYEEFVRPSGDRVPYTLYVPPTYRSAERYPLIVYLQVLGQQSTADKLRFPGISLAIDLALERREPIDFLVLFPGGSQGKWNPGSDESALVIELVDEVCRRFSVDNDRVVLTGLANGGPGVWNLAREYPDRWAAIVPLTALRGSVPASRVAPIPCWCFHSELNGAEQGRTEVKALELAGGKPRLTEVAAGGTIWNQTYLNKELYGWLAGQRRKPR